MKNTQSWGGYGRKTQKTTFRDRGLNDPAPVDGPSRPARSAPAAESPAETRSAPGGRDPAYWHLAMYFRDLAAKDRIQLRVGPPIIYDDIRQAFAAIGLESGGRKFEDDLTYAQVYRDGTGKELAWEKVAEAVMDEFWTYVWDRQALSYFCDTERLDGLLWSVCHRWRNERARPTGRATAEPMTWNRERRRRTQDDSV